MTIREIGCEEKYLNRLWTWYTSRLSRWWWRRCKFHIERISSTAG